MTTSLLPAIMAPNSSIKVCLEQASWIASCLPVASIIGFIYSAMLMHRFGRRIAFIVGSVLNIIGLCITYAARDYTDLLIGRIVSGISIGGTGAQSAVVLGEYSSPKYKEMFLNLKSTALYAGSTTVHLLGFYLHWRVNILLCLIPSLLSLAISWTWPESPAWLVSNAKIRECTKSFLWLRGDDEKAKNELNEMIKAYTIKKSETDSTNKVIEIAKKFTDKTFVKPMFIIFLGSVLLETSGRHIFPAYATFIINEITGDNKYSMYYTLSLDIIITVSTTFSFGLIKIMKVRKLLFTTGVASIISLLSMCLYMYLASVNVITNIPWISILLFVLSVILLNLGCTPIPMTLLGTLYPIEHKGVGLTMSGTILCGCVFVTMKTTPILIVYIKIYGMFTLLTCMTGLVLLVLYFILPETKNRTLVEIEYYFREGAFKRDEEDIKDPETRKRLIV